MSDIVEDIIKKFYEYKSNTVTSRTPSLILGRESFEMLKAAMEYALQASTCMDTGSKVGEFMGMDIIVMEDKKFHVEVR